MVPVSGAVRRRSGPALAGPGAEVGEVAAKADAEEVLVAGRLAVFGVAGADEFGGLGASDGGEFLEDSGFEEGRRRRHG